MKSSPYTEKYTAHTQYVVPGSRYKYGGENGVRYTYGQHLKYGGISDVTVDNRIPYVNKYSGKNTSYLRKYPLKNAEEVL